MREKRTLLGVEREYVTETWDGETHRLQATIVLVETVDLYEGKGLSAALARGCGYRTIGLLKEAWMRSHPRSPFAKAVYFALGDVRDRNLFLQRDVWRGGDYTTSMSDSVIDDLPALDPAEIRALAAHNRQKDAARAVTRQEMAASETLAERMARIEAGGEAALHVVKRDVAVIGQRVVQGERKLAARGS